MSDEWRSADSLFDEEAASFQNEQKERASWTRTRAETKAIIKEATNAAKKLTKSFRDPAPKQAGKNVRRSPMRYGVPRQMEIPE